uniref:Sushi domain-containing protein n=1 Tax=Chromera velia CCMP2878 TaxID=1169474 RepID=A0A0G4FC08_9ALVE|eukprot:Cvel_16264.t1-p1 / transcript=Cvel_16264.t1 / gene=Cvel_16264 / organism=Chromera_velia_CCMP2878 / gene_product=hypothetical protein / transcript_product=hypothetical protein / location=Cvel_scaffold1245:11536-15822(+) / protein_length=608 / sequence_SO=supercontig / SO=protein_coding / is_pseudo=false
MLHRALLVLLLGGVRRTEALSCNEVNDPEPNALGAQLSRTDSGQVGVTGETAVFAYACTEGYTLRLATTSGNRAEGSSATEWANGVEGAVLFRCTGDAQESTGNGGGTVPGSSWKGEVPTCIGGGSPWGTILKRIDVAETEVELPSEGRGRVGFSDSLRSRGQGLSDEGERRQFVREMVALLGDNGLEDGSEISTEDLPFSESISSKVKDVAVFNKKLYVDSAVEELDLETADEEGKIMGVYFALTQVSDSCTLRHDGEEATCTLIGENAYSCVVTNGNGNDAREGDVINLATASRTKGFQFVSVLGSVTMYIDPFPLPTIISLPFWMVVLIASISSACLVGPLSFMAWWCWYLGRKRKEEDGYGLTRMQTSDLSGGKRHTTESAGGSVEEGGKEDLIKYSLRVRVDRLAGEEQTQAPQREGLPVDRWGLTEGNRSVTVDRLGIEEEEEEEENGSEDQSGECLEVKSPARAEGKAEEAHSFHVPQREGVEVSLQREHSDSEEDSERKDAREGQLEMSGHAEHITRLSNWVEDVRDEGSPRDTSIWTAEEEGRLADFGREDQREVGQNETRLRGRGGVEMTMGDRWSERDSEGPIPEEDDAVFSVPTTP